MHGHGEYIWRAFYNDTFAFPIQNIYRGFWERGKRSGEGTMTFGDDTGMKLVGEWDQDFKHGSGYLICGNGKVLEHPALFQYDKPMHIMKEVSAWSIRSTRLLKSLEIPIFTAPQYVNVGFYVDQVLEAVGSINVDKFKALKTFEERCVRYTLIRNLVQLKELYKEYASLAAKTQLTFEPVLIRLFLWQFYKDRDIWKRGISLAETDRILTDNPDSCLESVHDPFEPIYFWQFLMSLIGVALTTYSLDEIEEIEDSSVQGVCASVIKKFFDEVIFTKLGVNHQSKYRFIRLQVTIIF